MDEPIEKGEEPIADDEILYRRIPKIANWYDPNSDLPVSSAAFRPNENDQTGISVSRAKYTSLTDAANGRPDKEYFVIELRYADLLANGIQVLPEPLENDPGHARMPQLTPTARKTDAKACKEIQCQLAALANQEQRIHGPFKNGEHV